MKLSTALRLAEHDVVAFVGGGGKTTAMFKLAAEIVERGGRVITTTRVFAAQIRLAPFMFNHRHPCWKRFPARPMSSPSAKWMRWRARRSTLRRSP